MIWKGYVYEIDEFKLKIRKLILTLKIVFRQIIFDNGIYQINY